MTKILIMILALSLLVNVIMGGLLFGKIMNDSNQTRILYEKAIAGLEISATQNLPMLLNDNQNNKVIKFHSAITRLYDTNLKLVAIESDFKIYGIDIQPLIESVQSLIFEANSTIGHDLSSTEIEALINDTNIILRQVPKKYDLKSIKKSMKAYERKIW